MKRKLVKQGAATLMVSIPSKWARKFNLGKGDDLEVEEKGNSLVLGIEGKKGKQEISLNLTSLTESSVRTVIVNAYRLGYDIIRLNFKEKSSIKIIKDTIKNYLIGFEISNQTDYSCVVENITEPSESQFDNIFNKILLNIDELFIIAEKNLKGEKREYLETEMKIQQFDNFCRRIISKNNLQEEYLLQWNFHSELIHAQRHLYHLLKYMDEHKVKFNKEEFALIKETKSIFDMLKEGYLKKDISILEKIHDLEKEMVYKKGYRELEKSKFAIINHHLVSAIRGFYLCTSPLAGLFISQKKDMQ